ncbi:hypothetical protein J132_02100 [Termitomyces sp. J132]|nr:hypothetical protein J132_02100 [Termitomyces sp. J132]
MEAPVTTRPLNPRTSSINPPNLQKTPNAPPNFRPCPAPISANSDASPANSDDPLANFGAFPAATDTYPGSPKPREPPPVPDIHHPSPTQHPGSSDLFRSITTTSGRPAFPNDPINVSARPDTRSQPTPTCSVELRQAPPPQPTYPKVLQYLISPGLISVSRSYLSLPVLSHLHFVIVLIIVSYLHSNLLLFHIISSDAVSVTPSDRCAQVFINPNDLTNSATTITTPDTPSPGLNLALRLVLDSINSKGSPIKPRLRPH